jgi:hypothetical protein
VAYPDPVPVVKIKDAREFKDRLDNFKLTSAQKKFYADGRRKFKKQQ